jgi:HemY protein
MKAQLWGKARSYLESSLAISPRTDAYALYGQLLKELGEEDEAASAFRSGLALVTPGLNDLPALGAPRTPMRSDDDVSEAGTVESRATR